MEVAKQMATTKGIQLPVESEILQGEVSKFSDLNLVCPKHHSNGEKQVREKKEGECAFQLHLLWFFGKEIV